MEQTGFGSDGKYEITEKTLLKDKLKVTKDNALRYCKVYIAVSPVFG